MVLSPDLLRIIFLVGFKSDLTEQGHESNVENHVWLYWHGASLENDAYRHYIYIP